MKNLAEKFKAWLKNPQIGTDKVKFNLTYYLMLPWKRPILKPDAMTFWGYTDGKLTIWREFFSIRTFTIHYLHEAKQQIKYFPKRFKVEVEWLPILALPLGQEKTIKIPVSFAIAFDAGQMVTTINSDNTTISVTHTTSGANRTMGAMGYWTRGDATARATYAGTSLTIVFGGGGGQNTGFKLIAPTSGANTFTFFDSTANGSSAGRCGLASFTGGDQTESLDASNTGTARSLSVTTLTANSFMFDFVNYDPNTGGPATVVAGQTLIGQENGTSVRQGAVSSYKAGTTVGSYNFDYTGIATPTQFHGILAMKELQPIPTNGKFFALFR